MKNDLAWQNAAWPISMKKIHKEFIIQPQPNANSKVRIEEISHQPVFEDSFFIVIKQRRFIEHDLCLI